MPPNKLLALRPLFAVTMMATGASKALTSAYAVIRRLIAESETPVSEAIWVPGHAQQILLSAAQDEAAHGKKQTRPARLISKKHPRSIYAIPTFQLISSRLPRSAAT